MAGLVALRAFSQRWQFLRANAVVLEAEGVHREVREHVYAHVAQTNDA